MAKKYNFPNIKCINPLSVTMESINIDTEFCQRESTFVTNCLRLLDTYASEIAKICVLWTFWPVI